jgi:LysM repeat protein
VERICPFLALAGDARTVVGAFDSEHRCGAVRPPLLLDREQQLSTCLIAEHRSCPRYLAAQETRGSTIAGWPAPSVDARLLSTRLVLGPDAAGRIRNVAQRSSVGSRWGLGAAAAVVGAAAVTASATGALDRFGLGAAPSGTAAPTDTPTPPTQPAIGGPSPRPPLATPTPLPTIPPPTATPIQTRSPRAPTPTPAPQARTYVVQSGDTLAAIAVRFGTSVEAIQAANGIADTDVILIGQVLVIP